MTLIKNVTSNPLGTRGPLRGCNIISQTWKVNDYVVSNPVNDGTTHHANCDHNNGENCKTHKYTIDFTMAIPTDNMHEGNKIFHDYEFLGPNQTLAINTLLYGTDPLPSPMPTNMSEYRPFKPILTELKVFSLELAYIRKTVTPAPTPRPTRSARDCVISDWSTWTSCSKSCGGGTQSKYRIVEVENEGNGKNCSAVEAEDGLGWTQSQTCNDVVCPVDCVMQGWQAWGDCETGEQNNQNQSCSKSANDGTHTRINTITTLPVNGTSCMQVAALTHPDSAAQWGLTCNHTSMTCTESRPCTDQTCPIDCTVTAWTNWTDCSKECGTGQKTRYRAIDTPAYYGGVMGECDNLTQSEDCNVEYCPQDCVVSEWSAWGSCDKSCGAEPVGTRLFGAKQIRTRYVLTPAESGGHKCPSLTQSKLCALHPCGATVCKSDDPDEFPLTCTYENGIVYTHHVNDVHKDDLFMCYHNYVTEVCTCLCWPKAQITANNIPTNRGVHACGVNNTCVEI